MPYIVYPGSFSTTSKGGVSSRRIRLPLVQHLLPKYPNKTNGSKNFKVLKIRDSVKFFSFSLFIRFFIYKIGSSVDPPTEYGSG